MRTLGLVAGYVIVDVCSWHLSLPLYLGVQVGKTIHVRDE